MFLRKLEYTRETLVAFKREMEEKAAQAKKGGASGGAFGGFGGFGGAGANDKKAVSCTIDLSVRKSEPITVFILWV